MINQIDGTPIFFLHVFEWSDTLLRQTTRRWRHSVVWKCNEQVNDIVWDEKRHLVIVAFVMTHTWTFDRQCVHPHTGSINAKNSRWLRHKHLWSGFRICEMSQTRMRILLHFGNDADQLIKAHCYDYMMIGCWTPRPSPGIVAPLQSLHFDIDYQNNPKCLVISRNT